MAGCSTPGAPAATGGPGAAGLIIVTSGGTALGDGDSDIPPTLDLGISGDGVGATDVTVALDGTPLALRQDRDTVRASVPALEYESRHRLNLVVSGRPPQAVAFRVVGRTSVSAAAWRDAQGSVADVVFQRAPDRAQLARVLGSASATWADNTHLRLRWSATPPAALAIPAGLTASRGSVLQGPLRLALDDLSVSAIRRVTVPAVGAPHAALTMFSVSEAGAHASVRAHAAQVVALAPTGWRAHPDGSLSGEPDGVTVATGHDAGTGVWPLLQNDAGDQTGTSSLLGDSAAMGRLVTATVAGAHQVRARGIHLDFEGVSGADRDRLTALVGTFATALHASGMQLAVDVVPHRHTGTNAASEAYDLPAIAAKADLLVMMSYDQHTAGGGPGPVAGLDWQADVLGASLDGLPANHVLMGVPLYARRWAATSPGARDYSEAVSTALGDRDVHYDYNFAAASPLLRGTDSGGSTQTWFDDGDSLARKLAAVRGLGLAGAAGWRLGFEDPAFWALDT